MEQHACEQNAKKTREQFIQKRITLFFSSLQTLFFNIKYTSMKPPIKEVDLCCLNSPIIFGVTIHHKRTWRNHVVTGANKNESLWRVWTKVRNRHLRGYYGHFFQLWNMISILWSQHRLFLSFAQQHPGDRFLRAGVVTGDVMETAANISFKLATAK